MCVIESLTRVDDQVAVTEYEAIKAEYDLERACLSQMVKLETTLHDSRPLVQEVTTKLGVFASVWAAVRPQSFYCGKLGNTLTCIMFQITADIRKLKNSLHRAEDPASQVRTLDTCA
jgi:hypothetical protein